MKLSAEVEQMMMRISLYAEQKGHEFITPEHILYGLLFNSAFSGALLSCNGDIARLQQDLEQYMEENIMTIEKIEKMCNIAF